MRQRASRACSCPRRSRRRAPPPSPARSSRFTSSSARRSRARVGERDVLEADAVARRAGTVASAPSTSARGVVLEPGHALRAVEPDAAQEADLADGRADVGREPRARRQHQQHVARRRAQPRRHEHDRADVGAPKSAQPPACHARCRCFAPPRPAVPALPGRAAAPHQLRADARHAHLLAGGGGGRRCRRDGGPGAAPKRRAPRRRARRRDARWRSAPSAGEDASSASAGWIDTSSARVTPRRSTQPQVVKSDMYMWSSTNTWLRSTARRSRYSGRSWCSMRRDAGLQLRHVRLERDRHRSRKWRWVRSLTRRRNQVATAESAEAERRARAPARGARPRCRRPAASATARSARRAARPAARARTRRRQPRLRAVAALQRAPHRGQRRRQVVSRGHRARRPPRRRRRSADAWSSNIVR